jgi:hypothetical protein
MASGGAMNIYYYSWIISVVAFVIGFILITIFGLPKWLKEEKNKKVITEEQPAKAAENKSFSLNVNINSGDFTNANMDTERMERVFSNLTDIIKGGDSNAERQAITEARTKETKNKA